MANYITGTTVQNARYDEVQGETYVSDGGVIDSSTVVSGNLFVMSGGTAINTIVSRWGAVIASSGGTAINTTASYYGSLIVNSGGTAINTTASYYGSVTVYSGGELSNTSIGSSGTLTVSSGGVARDINVAYWAYLNIYGGTITGQVTLAYSAYGYVSGNPTIDFDISAIGPDAGARVTYLNRLSNWENANFTLTVSETQEIGSYTLATGASYFSNDILVRTANGDQIDVLTVEGNVVRLGDITFRLTAGGYNSNLTLTVSEVDYIPPTVTNIQPNTTESTMHPVVVTAEFKDNRELASSLYRFGETDDWTPYNSAGVRVTRNGTVYFKAIDADGNESEIVSYSVTNIAPMPDNVTLGYIVPSGQTVTVPEGEIYLDPIVSQNGTLRIYGGTVTGADICYGGRILVSSGLAEQTTNSGRISVVSGGVIADTLLATNNATVEISSNGRAERLTNYGVVSIFEGGTANHIENESNGRLYFYSNSVADDVRVKSGQIYIYYGATITNLDVSSDAFMFLPVYSGNLVSGMYRGNAIELKDNRISGIGIESARFAVDWGGRAENMSVLKSGYLNVSSGGSALETVVESGGSMTVGFNGYAETMTVNQGGVLSIFSSGSAYGIRENGGCVFIADDSDITFVPQTLDGLVLSSASATVHSATTVRNVELSSGRLDVFSGGRVEGARFSNGSIYNSGGLLADIQLESGWVYLSSGGTALRPTLDEGWFYISSGGIAEDFTINGGSVIVSAGGSIGEAVMHGGDMTVSSDGVVDYVQIQDYGVVSAYGTVKSAEVYSNSLLIVPYSATIEVIRENGGWVEISSYVTATFVSNSFSGLVLEPYRSASLHSGTTANSTLIDYYSKLTVFSGGVARDTRLMDSGTMNVSSGGFADGVMIENGYLYVGSDAEAEHITVSSGGALYVSSGGTARNVVWTPFEGTIFVSEGGFISFANVHSGVFYGSRSDTLISSAASMDSIVVNNYYSIHVMSDGTADNVSVYRGSAFIYDGGTMNAPNISAGYVKLYTGARMNNALIGYNGDVTVFSGAVMESATINYRGRAYVSEGGLAKDTLLNGGSLVAYDGGVLSGITASYGYIEVSSGGLASAISVDATSVTVQSGGSMDRLAVNNGTVIIMSGGTATNLDWTPSIGSLAIRKGASVTFTSEYSGVYYSVDNQLVSHTDLLESVEIESGCVFVMSGGTANELNLLDASVYVTEGGRISNVTVQPRGKITVSSGGRADNTSLGIESGSHVYNASLDVVDGGEVYHTVLEKRGFLYLADNGVAYDTTVGCSAGINISSGGTASGFTVASGGSVSCTDGTLTGRMTIEDGARISINSYSTLDFDISGITPDSDPLINNYSLIYSSARITITVSADQECGKYILAESAANFSNNYYPITVQNTDGEVFGTVTLSSETPMNCNGIDYWLDRDENNTLTLTLIANALPTVTNIQVSETELTSQPVVVTAEFADDIELVSSLYRFDTDTEWFEYVDGVTVYKNSLIHFKAVDYTGHESEKADCEVTNIVNPVISGYTVRFGANDILSSGERLEGATMASNTTLTILSGGTANSTLIDDPEGEWNYFSAFSAAMFLSSGGVVNGTTVGMGGSVCVFEGGLANETYVFGSIYNSSYSYYSGGSLNVFSGGTATGTTVAPGGMFHVSSGGTAIDTLLSAPVETSTYYYPGYSYYPTYSYRMRPYMCVSEGGVASGVSLFNVYSSLDVYSGGTVYDVSVTSGGVIVSGGSVSGVTMNGASLNIYSGAVVDDYTGSESGSVGVNTGAALNGFSLSSQTMFISYGGKAASGSINDRSLINIASGGSLDSVVVNSGCSISLASGGKATNILENGGCVFAYNSDAKFLSNHMSGFVLSNTTATVHSGTTMTDVTMSSGFIELYSGGIVNGITANGGRVTLGGATVCDAFLSSASLNLYSGGTATRTKLTSASLNISSGGIANDVTINSSGTLYLYSGGTANGVTITSQSYAMIYHQGILNDVTIGSGARLSVESGCSVTGLVLDSAAYLYVTLTPETYLEGVSGGDAFVIRDGILSDRIVENTRFYLSSGCVASNITVLRNGGLTIRDGVTADRITVSSGGSFEIAGGTVTNFTADKPFYLTLNLTPDTYFAGTYQGKSFEIQGKVLSGFTIQPSHNFYIYSGYLITDTVLASHAYLNIGSGATANMTTVASTASMYIASGGIAKETFVSSGGYATIYSGGVQDGLTISSGGRVYVSNGGTLTGRISIQSGGSISASYGALVDFDISRMALGESALINDFSPLSWAVDCSITVSDKQYSGIYRLAEGVQDSYTNLITVKNTLGEELGKLTLAPENYSYYSGNYGPTLENGDFNYALNLTDGVLSLTVSGPYEPAISGIRPSTTKPTNQDVVVFADFASTALSRRYKLGDDGEWTDYVDGVIVKQNNVVYFQAVDSFGVESDVFQWTVSNIDREPPEKPKAGVDVAGPATRPVHVSASFSADSTAREFSMDGGETWNDYSSAIEVSENCEILFRGQDAAGNFSEVERFTVNNYTKVWSGTVVSSGMSVVVPNGFTFYTTLVEHGGIFRVDRYGSAFDTVVNLAGSASICEAAYVSGLTLNSFGLCSIDYQGSATDVVIHSGANLLIYGLGRADNLTLSSGGYCNVYSGGRVSAATMNGGHMILYSGASLTDATVNSGGYLWAEDSASINSATVNIGGQLVIDPLGKGTCVIENGGEVCLEDEASDVSFMANTFSGAVLSSGNVATVHSGTVAQDTIVGSGAYLEVFSGGLAKDTVVSSGGRVVCSAGTVNGLALSSSGTIAFTSGGTLTGQVVIEDGGRVSMGEGFVVDFDISGLAPGAPARYNTLRWRGAKNTFTLTVSDAQAEGTYVLADNYAGFEGVISVRDALGETFGSLSFGNTLTTRSSEFTLGLDGDALILVAVVPDLVAPTLSSIQENTDPNGMYCVVTATFSDDIALASVEYKVGESGTWTDYLDGVTVYDNVTVYFRATDAAGNVSETVAHEVLSVDTEPPVITLTGDNTTPLQSTTLTASTEPGLEIFFSLDKTNWTKYEDGILIDANATYYFRATDAAGNVGTAERTFTNIDTTPPAAPVVSATIQGGTMTNSSVFVSASFSSDTALGEYSFDNEDWSPYTAPVEFTGNGTVWFRGTDAAGNVSDPVAYTVDNIDTEPPVITLSGDNSTLLSSSTLTANTEDGLDLFYSRDKKNWTKYEGAITVTANGTYYFRATDAAGNIGSAEYTFTNIDNQPPEISITGDNITPLRSAILMASTEDGLDLFYSTDEKTWMKYEGAITVTANGTYYFKATDAVGNTFMTEYVFDNIDTTPPAAPVATASLTQPTNGSVEVSASFSDDSVVREYSVDGIIWKAYTGAVMFDRNGTVWFRGTDAAGNVSDLTRYTVGNIDTDAPAAPVATASLTQPTNGSVEVSASFSDDSVVREYSVDGIIWKAYTGAVTFDRNGTVWFRGIDEAGNMSEPTVYTVDNIDTTPPKITLSGDNVNPLQSVTLTVSTEAGLDIFFSTDQETWTKYDGQIDVTANGTYYFKATDAAGNVGINSIVFENIVQPPVSDIAPQTQTWETVEAATQYVLEYSTDDFEHVIQLVVDSNSLDSFQMPAGSYQMRVKPVGGEEWTVASPVVAEEATSEPKLIISNADGNADVFFVNAAGTWGSIYAAQHTGSTNDVWGGTGEHAVLYGRNKLTDVIEGSTDANILLMTDDANGDALFVDDIYSASPDELGLSQSRIAQIDEIRAGAGNDIVDMTSDRFEYTGDGLTIRGGDGNDTIWANKGDNMLFGDAGNDRIVGASGNDVIAGGIGNDRMHGGGGDDVFTFCENWGVDNVEQLAGGTVTLWFAEGSQDNWDVSTLTYTDGDNSVKVSGVTADKVTLKFGDDSSAQYASLISKGAFFDATSERIFEESGKGMLAKL